MNNRDEMKKLLEATQAPQKRRLSEDEYGRDQGAMYEPQMPESEEEFFDMIQDQSTLPASDEYNYQGEGRGDDISIEGNEVYHGDRHMGTLSAKGPNMIVMRGSYTDDGGEELIGAIVKSAEGMDVYFYKPGYVGTNDNLKAALDTLIVAAWG